MQKTPDAPRTFSQRIFYGWILVPMAFVCYGLTFSPAYENWGFFAPKAAKDLNITGAQVGAVFGLFSLWYQAATPLTSWAIHRFGLRVTITFGALLMSLGMYMLSQATSLLHCYIAYPLVMGTGAALATVLPMQTLATFWFTRYRARTMAVIMAGNTGFGAMLAPLNYYFVEYSDWRVAWQFYAVVAFLVALTVAVFFRNRPQDVGQFPDGIDPESEKSKTLAAVNKAIPANHRYPSQLRDAVLTGQFLLVVLSGIAYVTAWSTFAAHGRLHMETFAFGALASASVISWKNSMSTAGRLFSAVADFMAPNRLLALALLAEGLGMAGLGYSTTPLSASVCAFVFGLGYGTAVVCVALTIAYVCGPTLFVAAAGVSRMIQGLVSAAFPVLAGAVADATGSYTVPFVGTGLVAITGAVGVWFCRPLSAKS